MSKALSRLGADRSGVRLLLHLQSRYQRKFLQRLKYSVGDGLTLSDSSEYSVDDRLPSLPTVDAQKIRAAAVEASSLELGTVVSVDVLSIQISSTPTLPEDAQDTFYDSELLCLVLRAKRNGLMATSLYVWRGTAHRHSPEEDQKLDDLASRYRAPIVRYWLCWVSLD